MPLVNEELKFKQNAQANDTFNQKQSFNSNNAQANEASPTPKGLLTLPPALMQIVPWIPFALEAISGQKVPAIGGTIGEIQSGLQQVQFSLTQLLSNQQRMLSGQQQLYTKLESLESNASSQLNSLTQQMQTFKLSATEIQRHLELSLKPKELEN